MSDNLYKRQLRNIDLARGWIDHYAIDELYEMDSITSHAVKKLLIAGSRSGGKTKKQDLIEARNQLNRAIDDIELVEELEGYSHNQAVQNVESDGDIERLRSEIRKRGGIKTKG